MRFAPHNLSAAQLGFLVAVILPLWAGGFWLYNAWRMGRLKWKPKKRANPHLVCAVILLGIVLSATLLVMMK